MALSKPRNILWHLMGVYLERLYTSPLKTKAITSCLLGALGNLLSQKISGAKRIREDSILAFALFGLLIGGPVPHYFYTYLQPLVRSPVSFLLVERFVYTPLFQLLALYLLALFEGKTHEESCKQLKKIYWPVLAANIKYLTLAHYLNIRFVPPMLRVLSANLIGFLWSIYLAQERAKAAKERGNKKWSGILFVTPNNIRYFYNYFFYNSKLQS